jgi:hypothetical protein
VSAQRAIRPTAGQTESKRRGHRSEQPTFQDVHVKVSSEVPLTAGRPPYRRGGTRGRRDWPGDDVARAFCFKEAFVVRLALIDEHFERFRTCSLSFVGVRPNEHEHTPLGVFGCSPPCSAQSRRWPSVLIPGGDVLSGYQSFMRALERHAPRVRIGGVRYAQLVGIGAPLIDRDHSEARGDVV